MSVTALSPPTDARAAAQDRWNREQLASLHAAMLEIRRRHADDACSEGSADGLGSPSTDAGDGPLVAITDDDRSSPPQPALAVVGERSPRPP